MKVIRAGRHLIGLSYLIRAEDEGDPGEGGMTIVMVDGEPVRLSAEDAGEFRGNLAEFDPATLPSTQRVPAVGKTRRLRRPPSTPPAETGSAK